MRGRRARITRKRLDKIRSDIKSKNIISPGKWTNIESDVNIFLKFKKNKPVVDSIGEFIGIYRPLVDGGTFEKTYPVSFNLVVWNFQKLELRHGLDKIVAACEKKINKISDRKGNKKYGDFVITDIFNVKKEDGVLSCVGKTNNKRIKGFLGRDALGLRVF